MNVDGSSLGTSRPGGGAILPDSSRHLISALSSYYGEATNMVIESWTLLDGLNMCNKMGISNVDVETDSEYLSKIVIGTIRAPKKWMLLSIRLFTYLLRTLRIPLLFLTTPMLWRTFVV
ncbi:hypothetical protein ACH5RR_001220 [Cinchona calisaya]|uniref:RNase H type-1 domain-containing protein n=1 Tax=Cinchona calisaya TaxID=153742 RepID=A0ABD3B2W2_9GENT